MYILASISFEKDDKYVFIAAACREFFSFKIHSYRFFFQNRTDDYLYLYIRNLENSRLKPVFRYTIIICICVGR